MAKLSKNEGIGQSYAHKLEKAGITSIETLRELCAALEGRKGIADKTGISEKLLLSWINQTDLARIEWVSEEHAKLFEATGVDSMPECAQRVTWFKRDLSSGDLSDCNTFEAAGL